MTGWVGGRGWGGGRGVRAVRVLVGGPMVWVRAGQSGCGCRGGRGTTRAACGRAGACLREGKGVGVGVGVGMVSGSLTGARSQRDMRSQVTPKPSQDVKLDKLRDGSPLLRQVFHPKHLNEVLSASRACCRVVLAGRGPLSGSKAVREQGATRIKYNCAKASLQTRDSTPPP